MGIQLLTGSIYTDSEINFSEDYYSFDVIKIDSIASNLVIQEGNGFRVEAKGVNENFSSVVKNDVLEIQEKKNIFFGSSDSEIIITVPNATELQKILIDAGAGKVKIDGINASDLDISQGAGIVEIENSTFAFTDISGGAGQMKIKNSVINNLELDGGVGEILVNAKIMNKVEIDCGIGEVNLDLLGFQEDYRLTVDKGVGSVFIAGEQMDSHTEFGNGTRQIVVDGGVGKVTVNFEN